VDFSSILKEYGLKSTPQRTAILSEIYKAGHIDIDRLHEKVMQNIKVPLGTLYRSISELSSAGILASVAINGLKTHYEIVKSSHSHFVCDECGMIEDVDCEPKSLIQTPIFQKNYSIKTVSLTAHGVCSKCYDNFLTGSTEALPK
jgi:Fe2+ or Zn2+ uptake regulation protein